MGFRTVVMLNNDMTHKWSKDAELGKKIERASHFALGGKRDPNAEIEGYGRVVECTHSTTQTFVALTHYDTFKPLAYSSWRTGDTDEDQKLRFLKSFADEMGYRLVKKPEPK